MKYRYKLVHLHSFPSKHSPDILSPSLLTHLIAHPPSLCLFKNQVQNLAIRGQQGATSSSSQTQTLQALSLKQSPVPIQPASLTKNPGQAPQASAGGKAASSSSSDGSFEAGRKGDGAAVTEARAINMSRSVTGISAQPLMAPGKQSPEGHRRQVQPPCCKSKRLNTCWTGNRHPRFPDRPSP